MSHRILVAEDSSVTQDLLKLMLGQRGHEVELVSDGAAALSRLSEGEFDVALLDFHMPELNGLQVVERYLSQGDRATRAHLIAMTGDVEGLLADEHNCELFDQVLPKPLNILTVCKVIEGLDNPEAAPPISKDAIQPSPAEPTMSEEPSWRADPIFKTDLKLLVWPDDFDPGSHNHQRRRSLTPVFDYDAIVVVGPVDKQGMASFWAAESLHLLPIFDLFGSLGRRADLCGSAKVSAEGPSLAASFKRRREDLHDDLVFSESLADRLLGRVHVADGNLTAFYEPGARELVAWNAALDSVVLAREAEKLRQDRFLNADFFERLHCCSDCGSARLIVHEECPQCRSSHLTEEAYLHHFRCAHQAPESQFQELGDLVCPKCRHQLRHFGHDYDKPGSMLMCQSCRHTSSEPAVGFRCLDCDRHIDGEAAILRDVWSYSISERGLDYIQAGSIYKGNAAQAVRFSELPLELVVTLNAAARRYNEKDEPFALVDFAYRAGREIEREHGTRLLGQLRTQFLQNLKVQIGERITIANGRNADFILIEKSEPGQVRSRLDEQCGRASATLRHDLNVQASVFGPEEFV